MELRIATAADASPQQVWSLFTDVERWPTMTKSIQEVRRLDSGTLRVGSEALVKQPRLPRARWRVTDLVPGQYFVWETTSPGLTTTGGHIMLPDRNRTKIILTRSVRGPLACLAEGVLGRQSRRYLSMESEGFRRSAEA